ncbi:MAG TPA: pseudaminic acid biosynthesis-associated methylase, partial [Alphaproteobacteria bacterium]
MSAPNRQIEKWRGDFGDAYVDRNPADAARIRASTAMWARILGRLAGDPPQSILEIGANVGANLVALRQVTGASLYALEPNAKARAALANSGIVPPEAVLDGVAETIPMENGAVDLAFTCGVLIHVAPERLLAACREIRRVASKYIVCIEYFADQPETRTYRGESELLFKRDFGGFWLDNFPELVPLDTGFNWRR